MGVPTEAAILAVSHMVSQRGRMWKEGKEGTVFMLIECKLKQLQFLTFGEFLVKVITRYIKIHYVKFQNVNFLALVRSCVLLAKTW